MIDLPFRRRLVLAAATLIGAALVAGPAAAAPAPNPASLSDIEVVNGSVRAVLTINPAITSAGGDGTIDHSSLKATLGGRSVPVAVTPAAQELRTSMLVIDTSGSMGVTGMAAATEAAKTYLTSAPADVLIGLIGFSDRPRLVVAPTKNRAALARALPALKSAGETSLYDALQLAVQQLGSTGSRSLVLLSDGGDTVRPGAMKGALAAISSSGIRSDVVGFRTGESQNTVLSAIGKAGHGYVLSASDATTLSNAFKAVARSLAGQVQFSLSIPAGLSGREDLVVSATANGKPVTADTALVLSSTDASATTKPSLPAGQPASAGALIAAEPANGGLDLRLVLGGLAVFLGLLGIGVMAISPVFTSAGSRRLQAMDQYVGITQARGSVQTVATPSAISEQILGLSDKLTRERDSTAKTAILLERADLPLRANEWYVLRSVAVVVTTAAAWFFFHGSAVTGMLAVIGGLLLGWFAPQVILSLMAKRRARKFEMQLPDVLTLLASSLATGFSLAQGVDAIVRDASEPSAKEFSRALAETRIGATLEDTLDHLAQRMGSVNLTWTTMAIRIQRQVGGNLAETLRTTATTLRERESLKRLVSGLSAEGKLSAYILVALPFALFFYMLLVNRPYIELLWTSPIGWGMIAGGAVAMVAGIFWMRSIVTVEV